MSRKVNLITTDDAFSVAIDGREYLVFSLDPTNDKVNVFFPHFDEVDICDNLDSMNYGEFSLEIRSAKLSKAPNLGDRPAAKAKPVIRAPQKVAKDILDGGDLGDITITKVTKIKPAIIRRRSESPLEEYQRNLILEMVAESWSSNPDQTKQETAEESHRIAEEVFGDDSSHNVMRVAGVRAALTRGAYEITMDDLISGGYEKRADA